ncbi:pseudouridine synthase PUS6 [Ascoidea rubescens DSM 1968]|uniref:Pseudouridine synthase n=1 Tax=Ascoidea rubescens DSM 1968 TaxID=1344418 RepID=A0A1D2VPA4_9ASCO|nr:pseudouridine synthase [Ascoidea rubescens DSM 1968]ODV63452.1 pseudouridine synthase [Ascoidea rubescens DSM 1968]
MSSYLFKNGLRIVPPHYITIDRFVRQSWADKHIVTTLLSAFDLKPYQYFATRKVSVTRKLPHLKENLVIDDPELLIDLVLRNSDLLSVVVHKHEIPVSDGTNFMEDANQNSFPKDEDRFKIPIVFEDDNLVVVNKPSGIPTHPTGRSYRLNSVTEVVKHQLNLEKIFNFNRLDRSTSGILIFSKNTKTNQKFQEQIAENKIKKSYLARVDGNFKEKHNTICNDLLFRISISGFPLQTTSLKEIMMNSLSVPQLAETHFKFLSYNPEKDQSLVICEPVTGRTHQIRIHLRNLGHPISNDTIYGFKGNTFKNSIETDKLIIQKILNHKELMEIISSKKNAKRRNKALTGKVCSECGTELFADPIKDDMLLYLHAFKYENIDNEWCFETTFPIWAKYEN